MSDSHLARLKENAAQSWSRYDAGIRGNRVVRRALRYLSHENALQGVVRIEADGLGLEKDRATQRKEFRRFVEGQKGVKKWVLYQEKTVNILGKAYLKNTVPIINPVTAEALTKRYGAIRRKWPEQQYFMHPWQYASAVMGLKSKHASTLAEVALSAASIMGILMRLDKTKRSLEKAQRVSPHILLNYICLYFVLVLYSMLATKPTMPRTRQLRPSPPKSPPRLAVRSRVWRPRDITPYTRGRPSSSRFPGAVHMKWGRRHGPSSRRPTWTSSLMGKRARISTAGALCTNWSTTSGSMA